MSNESPGTIEERWNAFMHHVAGDVKVAVGSTVVYGATYLLPETYGGTAFAVQAVTLMTNLMVALGLVHRLEEYRALRAESREAQKG